MCSKCPDNSNSTANSLSIDDCKCNAGYYGGGAANCTACPASSTSVSASAVRGNCTCVANYYGNLGNAAETCTACPANSVSAANSLSRSGCTCNANFYGNLGNAAESCTACPANSVSAANSLTRSGCTCKANYFGNLGNAAESCTACPANSVSVLNSTTFDKCTCNLGYWGDYSASPGACVACPRGKYGSSAKQSSESAGCTTCPAGKYGTLAGKTSESAGCASCTAPQFTAERGLTACQTCAAGFYNNVNNLPCKNCTNSFSPAETNKYYNSNGGTSQTGCTKGGTCSNALYYHYYSTPTTAFPRNTPDSCSVTFCTVLPYQYLSGAGGSSAPATDACPRGSCTNALVYHYYNTSAQQLPRNTPSSCTVDLCTNAGNNQFYTGAAGAVTRTTPTSCSVATCSNAAPDQYYPGPAGAVTRTGSADCPVKACTNARADQYYSGAGGAAAPTQDACPVAACTNAPLPGYNWSKSGGTTPTSCVHAFCNNTRRSDEYYTINGLGGSDGCQVARCAAQLPTGHYWLGAGDCAYQPCSNKPPYSEYAPFANNLDASCAFRCVEGYFLDPAVASCSPCPPGTFSPSKGATACAQCVAGLHYPATNAVLTAATGQTSCGFDCGDAYWRNGLNCVPFTSEITATMTTQAFALVLDGGSSLRLCNLSAPYQTTETVGNLPGGPFAAVAVHPRGDAAYLSNASGVFSLSLARPFRSQLDAVLRDQGQTSKIVPFRDGTVLLLLQNAGKVVRVLNLTSGASDVVWYTTSETVFVQDLDLLKDGSAAVAATYDAPHWRIIRINAQVWTASTLYVVSSQIRAIAATDSHVFAFVDAHLVRVDLATSDASIVSTDPRFAGVASAAAAVVRGRVFALAPDARAFYQLSPEGAVENQYGDPAKPASPADDATLGPVHQEAFAAPTSLALWIPGRPGYDPVASNETVGPCAPGQYGTGAAACQPCPAGTASDQYAAPACAPCPADFFAQSTGLLACSSCADYAAACTASGEYLAGCGQGSRGGCAPCYRDCQPGLRRRNCGSLSAGACEACPEQPATGRYFSASAECATADCSNAPPPGFFFAGPGFQNGTCPVQACPQKPANSAFTQGCAFACFRGFQASEGGCQACAPGSYSAEGLACSKCPKGSFAASPQASDCAPCPEATQCPSEGSTAPEPCPDGTYNPSSKKSACSACPPGSVSVLSRLECQQCPGGAVSTPANNRSRCEPCQEGTFSSNPADTACARCAPGSVSPQGSAACGPCAQGSVANVSRCEVCQEGTFSSNPALAQCARCAPGSVSAQGSAACAQCPQGSVAKVSRCEPCPEGTYSQNPSDQACTPCRNGSVAPGQGSPACRPCDPGSRSLDDRECAACGPGTYAQQGSAECTPCPPGYFAQAAGSACAPCPPNAFAAGTGQVACMACAEGKVSQGGSSDCSNCSAGKVPSSKSPGSCDPCQANSFAADQGWTLCRRCPNLHFAGQGATACELCVEGVHYPYNATLVQNASATCDFACSQGFARVVEQGRDRCAALVKSSVSFALRIQAAALTAAQLETYRLIVASILGVQAGRVKIARGNPRRALLQYDTELFFVVESDTDANTYALAYAVQAGGFQQSLNQVVQSLDEPLPAPLFVAASVDLLNVAPQSTAAPPPPPPPPPPIAPPPPALFVPAPSFKSQADHNETEVPAALIALLTLFALAYALPADFD